MFTLKCTKLFSLSCFQFNIKWIKFLFVLTLCTVFFSSCKDDEDDKEFTPEQIEEERIKEEKKGIVGTWQFTSSQIGSSFFADDSTDHRNIRKNLGAVGNVNSSELKLEANGNYTFTNQVIGGGSYVFDGKWELRRNPDLDVDFLQLEGLYRQLFIELDVDREYFTNDFAEKFENFRIDSKKENEIELVNNATIIDLEGIDAPPREIVVEGTYTIERQ